MNESIFFGHTLLLVASLWSASQKESLMCLTGLMVILDNLFVTKQIFLFGMEVTPTDAYMIGSLFAMNLLQDRFGKEAAKTMLSINTALLLFFAAMATVQILYKPSPHDTLHPAFTSILWQSPRIFLASITSFYLSQRIDLECFGFFRKRLTLPLAMLSSISISQAFDTIVFSFLALYGLVHSLWAIMALSYAVKCITLFCMTLFVRRRA